MKFPLFILIGDKVYEIIVLPTPGFKCASTCDLHGKLCKELNSEDFCDVLSDTQFEGRGITIKEVQKND